MNKTMAKTPEPSEGEPEFSRLRQLLEEAGRKQKLEKEKTHSLPGRSKDGHWAKSMFLSLLKLYASTLQGASMRWERVRGVLPGKSHSDAVAIDSRFEAPPDPTAVPWGRVLLLETRSFCQRIRFARERLAQREHNGLDLVCQTCAAGGSLWCYENVARCMQYMQALRRTCPWVGWAEMALIAETWRRALDTACCSLDSARTLREAHHGPLALSQAPSNSSSRGRK
jgi:hypothetical protein